MWFQVGCFLFAIWNFHTHKGSLYFSYIIFLRKHVWFKRISFEKFSFSISSRINIHYRNKIGLCSLWKNMVPNVKTSKIPPKNFFREYLKLWKEICQYLTTSQTAKNWKLNPSSLWYETFSIFRTFFMYLIRPMMEQNTKKIDKFCNKLSIQFDKRDKILMKNESRVEIWFFREKKMENTLNETDCN